MVKRRFTAIDYGFLGYIIRDNVTGNEYDDIKDFVTLLNNFNDENEELKADNRKIVELLSDIGLCADKGLKILCEINLEDLDITFQYGLGKRDKYD